MIHVYFLNLLFYNLFHNDILLFGNIVNFRPSPPYSWLFPSIPRPRNPQVEVACLVQSCRCRLDSWLFVSSAALGQLKPCSLTSHLSKQNKEYIKKNVKNSDKKKKKAVTGLQIRLISLPVSLSGHPSLRTFLTMVESDLVLNSPKGAEPPGCLHFHSNHLLYLILEFSGTRTDS